MNKKLRYIIVEDSEPDALFLSRMLMRGGYDPEFEVVETEEEFRSALEKGNWDLVVADYNLPRFSGLKALALLKESGIDLPFILVSGEVGEEIAVKSMLAGAHDFIVKGKWERLVPAIKRELKEARTRRERRELQEALRLQSQVAANMSEGVSIIRARDLVFVYANPRFEAMFGYAPGEMAGKHVSIINAPTEQSPTEIAAEIVEFIETKGYWRGEIKNIRKDGTPFWCHASASLFGHPEHGKVFISVHMDVTERKTAEEKLNQSNAELKEALRNLESSHALLFRQEKLASVGTLAAGVAHEILNPLNIISTIVQVMSMDEATEEQKEHFREIMNQIHRATRITNNLRMFSYRTKPEIKKVDVNALFEKTASLMEYDLSLENIIVVKKGDPSLPMVDGDEDLLAQVFMNLLTNARDAMKGGKKNIVTFTTRMIKEGIEICISDTGPGIPEAVIDKIFDPFFTTKDPNQGTGLGLSVLYSIITEKHRGTIRVESEEGKGATFVITFPKPSVVDRK